MNLSSDCGTNLSDGSANATEPSQRPYKYQEGWSDAFRAEADMDLVVEGLFLPAHSTMLCQSAILQSALRDTKNNGRIQLMSPFAGLTAYSVDILLSRLYLSSNPYPEDLDECYTALGLAVRLGFDTMVRGLVSVLNRESMQKALMQELERMNPESISRWLSVVTQIEDPMLRKLMSKFLANHYEVVLGPDGGDEWSTVRAQAGKDILHEVTALLWLRHLEEIQNLKERLIEFNVQCTSCHNHSSRLTCMLQLEQNHNAMTDSICISNCLCSRGSRRSLIRIQNT